MNMAVSLPFRRRKSRTQRVLETAQSALKLYASLKVARAAGPKVAKRVAKAATPGGDGGGGVTRVGRFVAIPAALVGAGVLVKRLTATGSPVTESPPRGFPPPSTPPSRPTPGGAPSMGEPGAPKSGTTTASSPTPGGDGGGSTTTPPTPPTP
jgi:hypothetical protein